MNRFEGRKALITGAGSGIGQATVARILAEGGMVAAADVSEDGLALTRQRAEEAGAADRLTTVVVDISTRRRYRTPSAARSRSSVACRCSINAAGILRSSHTAETSSSSGTRSSGSISPVPSWSRGRRCPRCSSPARASW